MAQSLRPSVLLCQLSSEIPLFSVLSVSLRLVSVFFPSFATRHFLPCAHTKREGRELNQSPLCKKKRRQERRRSDKYPVTIENTNSPNTARVRSMTIITGLPSKRLLILQPPCQPLPLPFQRLTVAPSLSRGIRCTHLSPHPDTPPFRPTTFFPLLAPPRRVVRHCHPDRSGPIFSAARFFRVGPRSGGIAAEPQSVCHQKNSKQDALPARCYLLTFPLITDL
jgi:hypothetical protein